MVERFPMPIPFGWFFVSYSSELAVGEVKPVHYFGEDLVIYRTESGVAGLAEAYCPHLGAHLGHGGTVDGEMIRCPFHSWAFDTTGACKDIPYAKIIPPAARKPGCLKTYPITETNGVVWAWYHPQNIAPMFEVEVLDEVTSPDWAEPIRYEWVFDSNPQEIAENGVDLAHFKYVHKMDAVPEGETHYDGHVRRSLAAGQRTMELPDGTVRTLDTEVRTLQTGAGQKSTRFKGMADLLLQVIATPVEHDKVELRFEFRHKKMAADAPEMEMIRRSIAGIIGQSGVEGDIPIWHTKIHRVRPLLCDGDGPVMRFREYFAQFYDFEGGPAARVAAE